MKDPGEAKPGSRTSFSFIIHHSSFITAFVLGAVTVAGFAPFYLFPLPVITLAALFAFWDRAKGARQAAWIGFAYGLGLFLFGVSWVYVSLHDFGAMPAPLAAAATLLFCAAIALLPAAAGYAAARFHVTPAIRLGLLVPALWTLTEWVRGWLFTGFPWLAAGYSQVPLSPLAGYAPILGIYGVTLATAASAGLLVVLWHRLTANDERGTRRAEGKSETPGKSHSSSRIPHPASRISRVILHPSSFILLAIWFAGWGLKQIAWTEPVGAPVTVSLLQGNIAQDLKWREDRVRPTLDAYRGLAEASGSRLIILPETALPLFLDQVPRDYLSAIGAHARRTGGDILIGVPERVASGEYFNSVVSFGSSPTQAYRKSHLVPFGEFIPLRPVLGWIVGVLAIPLQDFSRGGEDQRPLAVAGQRVAVNICYEDAFGEEIIRQLPEASLLVNVSNVAWFGRSIAPQQHLQISQARAIETGRYMLRATNTGVTAAINPRGEVVATAPEFTTASVTYRVQGYGGSTPYVRWSNYAVLVLCLALLALARRAGSRGARSAA
ncbi:MAG: apolipoprotein N-acyltransferase [Betaproteobacteria bacterium]|nr:apolipoprotein N-acyltransferase [Betaproteobacteria bacterium]